MSPAVSESHPVIIHHMRPGGRPPQLPPDEPHGRGRGGDLPEPDLPAADPPLLGNATIAMLVFMAAELMFFAGLIGAFTVFRFSGQPWPPPFQPRLPVAITALNTGVLLLSSYTFQQGYRGLKRGDTRALCQFLTVTGVLGILFLTIQGYEWIRLLSFGLTASSGTYGSTFYTIIGAHAFHVSLAVLWLLVVLIKAWMGHYTAEKRTGVMTCGMYWHMVVGLWPFLFFLVYLM